MAWKVDNIPEMKESRRDLGSMQSRFSRGLGIFPVRVPHDQGALVGIGSTSEQPHGRPMGHAEE